MNIDMHLSVRDFVYRLKSICTWLLGRQELPPRRLTFIREYVRLTELSREALNAEARLLAPYFDNPVLDNPDVYGDTSVRISVLMDGAKVEEQRRQEMGIPVPY